MKNIINYIRIKILQFLGLQSIIKDLKDKRVRIEQLEAQIRMIAGDVKVGVDYHHYPDERRESWAVVCLEGERKTFVNFYNLKDNDVRDVETFLKHFETKSKIVDSPFRMGKGFFTDRY